MTDARSAEPRRTAADLLKDVLEGNASASEALQQWPTAPHDELIEKTRCLLHHYRDDNDIRARDKKYAEWQEGEFRALLRELTAGR